MHPDYCRLLRHLFRLHRDNYAGRMPSFIQLQLNLPNGTQLRTEIMDITLKDDTPQTFAVVLKDKLGAVATATGALTVTSSDTTVASGSLSADFSQLTVSPAGAGKTGAATLTVADAADSLTATINVTVVASAPATIEIDAVQADTTPSSTEPSTATTPASDTPDATGA